MTRDFDPSTCPECGGPIHEFAYVDTWQRVKLCFDEDGELQVNGYPAAFETGEDYRDECYGCRTCSPEGMTLAELADAHRAKRSTP